MMGQSAPNDRAVKTVRRACGTGRTTRADQAKPERYRQLDRERYDVVVIGAGLGGLTAAALLAARGKAVLVVDQHYVAGGNATVFRRKGYVFDVGLHYIGGCHGGGLIPRVLRAAQADSVEWNELDPDGFDTFVFPDFRFRMPRGLAKLENRLLETFPREQAGIRRYMRMIEEMKQMSEAFASPRKALWLLPRSRLLLRWANSRYGEFLDSCTTDAKLRAVLAGQQGDYGLPPSRASTVIGAGMVLHYLDGGAYFPRGGGQVISDRLAAAIEKQGGKILLLCRARRIQVERGAVTGVEIESRHLGRRFVRAPVVISNADLKHTMVDLVDEGLLRRKTLRKVRGYEMSPALGVVYLGIRRDLKAEGHPNTNYWIYPDLDVERQYAATTAGLFHERPFCYVTIASLKDPDNGSLAPPGMTNLQLMTVAPSHPGAWGIDEASFADGSYRKNAQYRRLKDEFADRLIGLAEGVLPGLRDQIAYCEVATPLTHRRFTNASGGTSYGIAPSPDQYLMARPGWKTEVPGLYLCGASTRSGHGIAGVVVSGVEVAAAVAGRAVRRSVWSD